MNIIHNLTSVPNYWQIIPTLTEAEIESVIKLAADAYYNTESSLISDEIYDALIDKLHDINPKSKIFKNIGAPITTDTKEKLPFWMGSMDKIKGNQNEINAWKKKYPGPYILSDKLDGMSCLFVIDESDDIKLNSRGDGTHSKNISHLLNYINIDVEKFMNSINDDDGIIAVRGELIVSKQNFKLFEKNISNARSMASGIMNSKSTNVKIDQAKKLDFVAYEIILPVMSPEDQFKQLSKWGFDVASNKKVQDISLEMLDDLFDERKKNSKYEIDGIIVTQNKIHVRNNSGNPEYSFAYKGETETAITKVIEVIWTPSKDGLIIPRIHFEKVRISQADIEFTSGFNGKYISDNGIGVGSMIEIVRSGDVVPYIKSVRKHAAVTSTPSQYKYTWDKSHVNYVLRDIDNNITVIIKILTRFVKRIGVESMSEGIVTKLVNAGYKTILSIIVMKEKDFLKIDGFQKKLAEKIYNNLQSALKEINDIKLMSASNIFGRGFGERKIRMIINLYPQIITSYNKTTHDKWTNIIMNIPGFDVITTEKFLSSLPKYQKFRSKFTKIVDIPIKNIENDDSDDTDDTDDTDDIDDSDDTPNTKFKIFAGERIVFTGFRNMKWESFIESNGGTVTTGVSGSTTLLVYTPGSENTSKFIRATTLRIPKILKQDFSNKYGI